MVPSEHFLQFEVVLIHVYTCRWEGARDFCVLHHSMIEYCGNMKISRLLSPPPSLSLSLFFSLSLPPSPSLKVVGLLRWN